MTVTRFKKILEAVFNHELTVEDAWKLIDEEREVSGLPLEDK